AAARMWSPGSRASSDMGLWAGFLPACFSRRASFATHTAVAVRSSPANASAGINAITTARATLMAYTAAGTVSGFGTAEDDVAGAIGSIGALMNARFSPRTTVTKRSLKNAVSPGTRVPSGSLWDHDRSALSSALSASTSTCSATAADPQVPANNATASLNQISPPVLALGLALAMDSNRSWLG